MALCELSLVAASGVLVVLAALVAEAHGAQGARQSERSFTAVVHRLSCCVSCGAFLDQGSNLVPCWQAGFIYYVTQGSPSFDLLIKGQCIYEKVLDSLLTRCIFVTRTQIKRKSYQPVRPSPVPYSSSSPLTASPRS